MADIVGESSKKLYWRLPCRPQTDARCWVVEPAAATVCHTAIQESRMNNIMPTEIVCVGEYVT